jgi:hypothetical protein
MLAMETLGLAERIDEILREYDVAIPRESIRVGKLSAVSRSRPHVSRYSRKTDIFGEVQHARYSDRSPPATKEK